MSIDNIEKQRERERGKIKGRGGGSKSVRKSYRTSRDGKEILLELYRREMENKGCEKMWAVRYSPQKWNQLQKRSESEDEDMSVETEETPQYCIDVWS